MKRIFAFLVFLLLLAGIALVNLATMKPASGALNDRHPGSHPGATISTVPPDVPHIPE